LPGLAGCYRRVRRPRVTGCRAPYLPAGPGDPVVVYTGQVYIHNQSGQRKATGSYFTKQFAVEHLLDTALEPAIADHLDRVEALLARGDDAAAAEAFFDFRVADLAMGSAHFLVAAVDRIEARFTAFLTEHPVPAVSDELTRLLDAARSALGDQADYVEIETGALLRRQIARRCIYGLDLNLMAVELARLAIWIHTFVPGLPMSALNHNLIVGNSLTGIGTVAEVLDVLEPQRRPGQYSLFADEVETILASAKQRLLRAARTSEATKAEVRDAAKAYAEAMDDAADAKALFDAAVGVRLGIVSLLSGPDRAISAGKRPDVQAKVTELQAVHLPYLLPEVFLRDNPGFDVIIGNPPWETVVPKEDAWWSLRFPGLKGLAPQQMTREIARLRRSRPDLVAELDRDVARLELFRDVLLAGPYPGLGAGHPDLYQAFCWRIWSLVRDQGAAGIVLPRNALAGSGTAVWRSAIYDGGQFRDVTMLVNTGGWVFDDVHAQYTVGLTSIRRGADLPKIVSMRGPFHSLSSFEAGIQKDPLTFPAAEFRTWAAGGAFPILPDAAAAQVFIRLRAHPRLDAAPGEWAFRPVQGDFNAATDKHQWDPDVSAAHGDMPVYKGATINLWQPDTGTYLGWATASHVLPVLQEKRKRAARLARSAFYGMPVAHQASLPCLSPRIAFRNVTRATDSRTMIVVLVPPRVILSHGIPFLLQRAGDASDTAYLLGVLSLIPLDWYARRVVEINLVFEILNAFPIPRVEPDNPLRRRVVENAGRLAAVDQRYAGWAAEVGVPVGSVTDQATKDDLIAELDALVAHLYRLDKSDVEHIFVTFHRGWGYQTRLAAVLAHYDRWAAGLRETEDR
jgi:hypothetical protein